MKRTLKKWGIRFVATLITCGILLLIIVLNPLLSYAGKTKHTNYTIYHNKNISKELLTRLDAATLLVSESEIYDPALKLDICLNDGSEYPSLIQKINGPAFAMGFYNKVVLMSNSDPSCTYAQLNGYTWNMEQLLAHEMMHCFQYNDLGLLGSNPIADIPGWKWEGYPEYIARKNADQSDLVLNIDRLISTEKTVHNGWIYFADGTGTVIEYYKNWLLVQYCLNIKKISWKQLLADKTDQTIIYSEMINWYTRQKNNPEYDHLF